MVIKVNIPQNDYVRPTEVREDLVQDICDFIIEKMKSSNDISNGFYTLVIKAYCGQASMIEFLYKDSSHTKIYGFADTWSNDRSKYDVVKVRTCEMQVVFEAIQNAGYYIFPSYGLVGEYRFLFTNRPIHNGLTASRVAFNIFID